MVGTFNFNKFRSIEVLEYWSIGVMVKGLMSFFFNTPILHHSENLSTCMRLYADPSIILLLKGSICALPRSQPGERPVNIIYLWDFLQCIGRLPSSFQP